MRVQFCAAVMIGVLAGPAPAQDWVPVATGAAVTEMLAGRGLDAPDFADFYRADGVMGYFNKTYGTVVVRRWEVDAGGTLCSYIFAAPDKLVECTTFERDAADPARVRMRVVDRAYAVDARLTDTPPAEVIEAVEAAAGPEG